MYNFPFVRLFIAINLQPAIRTGLSAAVEPLRRIFPDARWVPEELLHMTVRFLDEQQQKLADELGTALGTIAMSYRAIPYSICGIGAFPNVRRPSVVWMGVHADSKLELLNHDVQSACSALGIPPEGRAFRPHITLARVRHHSAEAVRRFADAADNIHYEARTSVHSLDLMESRQQSGRMQYSVLHRAILRDR